MVIELIVLSAMKNAELYIKCDYRETVINVYPLWRIFILIIYIISYYENIGIWNIWGDT